MITKIYRTNTYMLKINTVFCIKRIILTQLKSLTKNKRQVLKNNNILKNKLQGLILLVYF